MLLTSYKETKDIMSKNLLKIVIAVVLTTLMGPVKLGILLSIIGCWILKFDFNLKMMINVGVYFLIISTSDNSVVILVALLVIFIINIFVKKDEKIFSKIMILCFGMCLRMLEEMYYDIYIFGLIVLAYFLFFTVQEKKLKECLSIKGLLTMIGTFIIFFLINFYSKDFYNFLWGISKMANSWIVLIFLICFAYSLEVFYYIFVFNLIKNLKK